MDSHWAVPSEIDLFFTGHPHLCDNCPDQAYAHILAPMRRNWNKLASLQMNRPPGIGPTYSNLRSLRKTSADLSGVSRGIMYLDSDRQNRSSQIRHALSHPLLPSAEQPAHQRSKGGVGQVRARRAMAIKMLSL